MKGINRGIKLIQLLRCVLGVWNRCSDHNSGKVDLVFHPSRSKCYNVSWEFHSVCTKVEQSVNTHLKGHSSAHRVLWGKKSPDRYESVKYEKIGTIECYPISCTNFNLLSGLRKNWRNWCTDEWMDEEAK